MSKTVYKKLKLFDHFFVYLRISEFFCSYCFLFCFVFFLNSFSALVHMIQNPDIYCKTDQRMVGELTACSG